jgi:hypothetical protein
VNGSNRSYQYQSGAPLDSQSTISRLENAPRRTEAARLTAALIDQIGMTVKPRRQEIFDIDDTFCAAHGGQQLAFWNAHHDERGFASIHIYHAASGTPVVAILRPARTPKGTEVRTVIKHLTKRMRKHWPKTRIIWRGDSHYGRVEAMDWADDTDYIFGLADNAALDAPVAKTADNLRFYHASCSIATHQWRRGDRPYARLKQHLLRRLPHKDLACHHIVDDDPLIGREIGIPGLTHSGQMSRPSVAMVRTAQGVVMVVFDQHCAAWVIAAMLYLTDEHLRNFFISLARQIVGRLHQ